MKGFRIVGLLLALVASDAALADKWDSRNGWIGRDGGRFDYNDGHPGRGLARGHDKHRSQVNIIVAPRAPVSAWAPRWNDRYDRHHDHRHDQVVFNSSLGFIAGAVVGMAVAPQFDNRSSYSRNTYVREYSDPVTVINRDSRGTSISLYKDRFGACYERETDYHGRVIKRRVADYNCNF